MRAPTAVIMGRQIKEARASGPKLGISVKGSRKIYGIPAICLKARTRMNPAVNGNARQ